MSLTKLLRFVLIWTLVMVNSLLIRQPSEHSFASPPSLFFILLIGLPLGSCVIRERIRRTEAIDKSWAAARLLGASEADVLGSNDLLAS
ncbi:MAG: hypothetical protein HC853_01530 [Anaerolineae bacterium]|nr:hypothetical protein [Anaerolineae bacterium]